MKGYYVPSLDTTIGLPLRRTLVRPSRRQASGVNIDQSAVQTRNTRRALRLLCGSLRPVDQIGTQSAQRSAKDANKTQVSNTLMTIDSTMHTSLKEKSRTQRCSLETIPKPKCFVILNQEGQKKNCRC
jgi:hypothetical protein